jgi:S-formylglutathione hydrolase FrmB
MPRAAHPGRDSFDIPGALAAARRPAELTLPDVVDLLGSEKVQTEGAGGAVETDYPVVTPNVPARVEPETRAPTQVIVGGDPAVVERWILEVPHGTALASDQYVDVKTSTNPQLQGARLRVVAELDSSTEPLRRVTCLFVNSGGS